MTHRFRTRGALALLTLFVVLAAPPLAAGPVAGADIALPRTPAGRLAAAWLAAFNPGDPGGMQAFNEKHITPGDLRERPMEQRLAAFRRMHGDIGALSVLEILDDDPVRLTFLAASAGGERVMVTVEANPAASEFLAGIGIEGAPEGEDLPPPPGPVGPPLGEAALRDSIDALLSAPGEGTAFSGVAHLVKGDRVVYRRAFGLAERRFGVANDLDTKFNIGSISKLFTTVAIGQLVAAGKLELDDRLSRHLPDYPREVADRITIQQLVEHRSGLGDIFGEEYDARDRSSLRALADFLPLFKDKPLRFEPGTDQYYSNAGFVVLGLVIERLTGQSYEDHMEKAVFAPAGMTDTGSSSIDGVIPRLATGYLTRRPGPERSNAASLPGLSSSAGGGYSTTADLVRFAQAFLSGRLMPVPYVAWALGGPPPKAGASTLLQPGELGIAGGAPGLNAELHLWPGSDLTLVVLANQDPPAAERAARRIAGLVRRTKLAGP